jgi:hypothetical protein
LHLGGATTGRWQEVAPPPASAWPAAVVCAAASAASLQCLHHCQHIPNNPFTLTIREWMPSPECRGHPPPARRPGRRPGRSARRRRARRQSRQSFFSGWRRGPLEGFYKVVHVHLRRRRRCAPGLPPPQPEARSCCGGTAQEFVCAIKTNQPADPLINTKKQKKSTNDMN